MPAPTDHRLFDLGDVVVLHEVDDLKRSGRTSELREAAKRADRRLKGDFREPAREGLPGWLDLEVPDDRFVATVLRLQ